MAYETHECALAKFELHLPDNYSGYQQRPVAHLREAHGPRLV